MRIDTGQHMRTEQRMKLAPRMIQSMEILQMAQAALEQRIAEELASNPTLELREPGPDPETIAQQRDQDLRDSGEGERELIVRDDDRDHVDDFERLSNLAEAYGEAWESNTYETGGSWAHRPRADSGERDAKLDAMANTAARAAGLADQLLEQWRMVETDPRIRAAGDFLIGQLDDDGYLRTPLQELLDIAPAGITEDDLTHALELLQQSIEPVGIGARDLRECLLLQIDAKMRSPQTANGGGDAPADLTLERRLVADHLHDIEANHLPKIAKALDVPIERVNQTKANLRQFHPHPGRLLVEDSPQRIYPDAIVEYDDELDHYTAHLTHERLPGLQLSRRYLKMLREAVIDKKTKEFVSANLRSARWLLDAIQQRHGTLQRVIDVVIEAQREFFDAGPQHLRPLPMTTVADQLGIHVATVSRAVSEKYIQTPRGIFPLRMFFSGGTETDAGDAMSWTAVQAKLKQIIDQEDTAKPYSDDQLVDKLKELGIDIARRTVAKYRKQLNIAPARQRRQY